MQKHNYKCELCGWNKVNPHTGKIPLEIHHKDGNWQNNKEDNLQVLCPNCHSLGESPICQKCGYTILVKCSKCSKVNTIQNIDYLVIATKV